MADVREAVRRREPGPHRANIEAAEGKDTGDHRQLHEAVSRIRRESEEEDSNVPEELSEEQAREGGRSLGCRKFIIAFYRKVISLRNDR